MAGLEPAAPVEQGGSLTDLVAQIGEWAEKTFLHTNAGILKHLEQEVAEAWDVLDRARCLTVTLNAHRDGAFGVTRSDFSKELAGCFVLLATLAHRNGVDLAAAIQAEHDRNLRSKWAYSSDTGLVQRVKS